MGNRPPKKQGGPSEPNPMDRIAEIAHEFEVGMRAERLDAEKAAVDPGSPQVKVSDEAGRDIKTTKALQIVWGDKPIIQPSPLVDVFRVPSQTTSDYYSVNLVTNSCECKYWRAHRKPCKHMKAARLWKQKQQIPSKYGREKTPNPHKNPPWYDRMKANEELFVWELARCLGAAIPYEVPDGKGRPRVRLGDLLVPAIIAAYHGKPTRKAIPQMGPLKEGGYVTHVPSPVTLRQYNRRKDVFTPIIREAIEKTALAVRKLESEFSIDSTIFKTPLSEIHLQRAGRGLQVFQKILTCKLHVAIGLESFVILAAEISDGDDNDKPFFKPLIDVLKRMNFRFDTVLADAGYYSSDNVEDANEYGAEVFIDYPVSAQPCGKVHHDAQLAHCKANDWEGDDYWNDHYRFRPLVETANSMLKRVIKRFVRARTEEARETELLLAVLAHNLCQLVMARAAHGIDIPFADDRALAIIDAVIAGNQKRLRAA